MQKYSAVKLSYGALLSALVFIGTQFFKVPLAFGYFNMGDCFVLLSGWLIGGPYAMIGAAIGACLADLLSGYVIYAPVTFILKALMVLLVHIAFRLVHKYGNPVRVIGYIIAAIVAELLMVAGYYLLEGFLYGFSAALISIPGNLVQGAVAVAISTLLIGVLKRTGVIDKVKRD